MEFIREIIDSDKLDQILALPRSFQDRKLEILVFPVQKNEEGITIDRNERKVLMEDSITQSLIGALPHPDISPDEIRALRLKKYDSTY